MRHGLLGQENMSAMLPIWGWQGVEDHLIQFSYNSNTSTVESVQMQRLLSLRH